MLEFPRHSCSSLVFHERLVEELHENKGKHDKEVKDSGKHHHHRKQPARVSLEGNVSVPQRRHGGQYPIEALDQTYRLLPLGFHEIAVHVHVNTDE